MTSTSKVRINVADLAQFLHDQFPSNDTAQMTTFITTHADSIKSKRGRKPGSTNKKDKKPKDPNAPKRPLSAYMVFLGHKRPLLKASQPDLKNTEVVSKIAADWRALDDKTEWEAKAEANKVAYTTLKADYLAQQVDETPTPTPPSTDKTSTLTMVELDGSDWWIDFNITPNKIYGTNDSSTPMKGIFLNGAPQFFS